MVISYVIAGGIEVATLCITALTAFGNGMSSGSTSGGTSPLTPFLLGTALAGCVAATHFINGASW